MDTYSQIKQHEARIAALETSGIVEDEYPGDDRLTELRFDLDQALDRLSAVEARCDTIAAIVANMEPGLPGGNEEESE
jgi:hypothetical protein